MPRSLTTDEFVEKARAIHGDIYDYSISEYTRAQEPVTIRCREHGDFTQKAYSHLNGRGCPDCAKQKLKNPRVGRKTGLDPLEEFKRRATDTHGDLYGYDKSVYVNSYTKLIVTCPEHGDFEVTPHNHISSASGCKRCYHERTRARQKGTKRPGIGGVSPMKSVDFLRKAMLRHDGKYDYSVTAYRSMREQIDVICPKHGQFSQLASAHASGQGCPTCARDATADSIDDFVRKAKLVHGDRFSYDKVNYINSLTPVVIVCSAHGDFYQLPNSHLQGRGCAKCASHISRAEIEVFEFVKGLAPDAKQTDRQTIKPLEIDILVPSANIGIEYCGLFFHSSAKDKTRRYHLEKHESCEQNGIRLITIFEDEWLEKREIVEATLAHFLGKSPRGFGARECSIREIDWSMAEGFLESHHMLGAGSSTKTNIGAFGPDGMLIAVMTFGAPSIERASTDTPEMKRFVTDKRNHPGIGSKMFSWAVAKYGFERVQAFVDRRWFTGKFKSLSGFELEGYTEPSFFWINASGRHKRRFITKEDLQEMEQFVGRALTKPEMMAELGYHRIWDCGKAKMVWKKPVSRTT